MRENSTTGIRINLSRNVEIFHADKMQKLAPKGTGHKNFDVLGLKH